MDGFAVGQFGDARLEKGALFVERMVERSTVRLRAKRQRSVGPAAGCFRGRETWPEIFRFPDNSLLNRESAPRLVNRRFRGTA